LGRGGDESRNGPSPGTLQVAAQAPDRAQAVSAVLEAGGLGRVAAPIISLLRPSIRYTVVQDGGTGPSRIGGVPHLAPGTGWPVGEGGPLSLVASVSLAEAATLLPDSGLPATGALAFFYDAVRQTAWGFDPADRDCWRVLHVPDGGATPAEAPAALAPDGRFSVASLHPRIEWTLPDLDSLAMDAIGLTLEESDAYGDLLGATEEPAHRLLGHLEPVQGEMQVECQLAAHGIYVGDPAGYRDPRAEALRPGADDWQLLLQLDSEDSVDMLWGDAGRLYFWIPRSSMAAGRWDDVWMILQCT
jgi:uncharacterized protein YwqG